MRYMPALHLRSPLPQFSASVRDANSTDADAALTRVAAAARAAADAAAEAIATAKAVASSIDERERLVRENERLRSQLAALTQTRSGATVGSDDTWRTAMIEPPFRGIRRDLRRKLQDGRYLSDFTDGLRTTPLTAIPFTYLAMLVPCIAFGRTLQV